MNPFLGQRLAAQKGAEDDLSGAINAKQAADQADADSDPEDE
jgi:hypothetical protein